MSFLLDVSTTEPIAKTASFFIASLVALFLVIALVVVISKKKK